MYRLSMITSCSRTYNYSFEFSLYIVRSCNHYALVIIAQNYCYVFSPFA